MQIPSVRRRTIHAAPVAVQAAELDQKAEEGRILTQANRIGRAWSKWINETRPGGWRQVDPNLEAEWVSFACKAGELDEGTRTKRVWTVAGGMGLEGDLVIRGTASNNNKIAYVVNTMTSDRRHLGIGGGVPFSPESLGSGRILTISIGQLSRLEPESEPLRALRASIVEQQRQTAGALGLGKVCSAVGDWLGKPQVREYFAQRVQILT